MPHKKLQRDMFQKAMFPRAMFPRTMFRKEVILLATTFFLITFFVTPVSAKEFQGQGTVSAVNSSAKKLKISHGPIKGLMDAMEMEFKVADPAMLDVGVGSKINFTLEEDKKGNLTVTDIEVTK